MASSTLIYMHDIGVKFIFTVKNSSGPVDLTSAQSITLYFQKPDKSIVSQYCSTTNASGGVVQYISKYEDFNQAGQWNMQLVIKFADKRVRHSSIPSVIVAKNLGN